MQHRLLHVHGLYGKALYADDLVLLFLLVVKCIACFLCGKRLCPEVLLQLGAVAHYLLFHLGDHGVDGGVHIAADLLAADNAAGVGNGDLYDVTVLFYGEGDMSLRIFREILIQLGNLLSHQIAEIIGYLDVFSIDRNTHIRFPFPAQHHRPMPGRYAALFAFLNYNILCPKQNA